MRRRRAPPSSDSIYLHLVLVPCNKATPIGYVRKNRVPTVSFNYSEITSPRNFPRIRASIIFLVISTVCKSIPSTLFITFPNGTARALFRERRREIKRERERDGKFWKGLLAWRAHISENGTESVPSLVSHVFFSFLLRTSRCDFPVTDTSPM